MIRRLVMAVGDTAGHVIPAIAVADAYTQLAGPVDVRFLAAGSGAGHWLIEKSGYALDYIPGSPVARERTSGQLLGWMRLGPGVRRARALLADHGSRLVIGTGGFGSAAPILAGRTLGLGTALIEPNVVPGLANRLLGRCVHRAYVAFEEAARFFPPARTLVTGIPVRRPPRVSQGRRPPALPRLRLLVTTGSRGERFLGTRVPRVAIALRRLGAAVEVRQQGGDMASSIEAEYRDAGIAAHVCPFIDDMPAALEWADIAIARAGAGTIGDMAMAGLPALLVPLADAARDHQALNANAVVRRGAAWSVREEQWEDERVARDILEVASDEARWTGMSHSMSALASGEATSGIVRDCEAWMEGRW